MQYRFKDFTEKANTALNLAMEAAQGFGHTYVGTEHILLGLLQENVGVAAVVLGGFGITAEKFEKKLLSATKVGVRTTVTPQDFSPRAKAVLEKSVKISAQQQYGYVGTEHILTAILQDKSSEGFHLLELLTVQAHTIEKTLGESYRPALSGTEKKPMREAKKGVLMQYGRDLTEMAKRGDIDPVIGRDAEIDRVIRILVRRTKNNPCLVGEPGVGKTAVAEGLALKIADGDVPDVLLHRRLINLDLNSMIAGTKYRGDFEERMKRVIEEITHSDEIILFLDEIHNLIGAGTAEGAVDASNILKPYLARGEMQLIGATTLQEYRKHIEKDAALERRFQPVKIEQPSIAATKSILFGLRDRYEAHHKVKISDEAVETAVELSDHYIADRFLPDKAIDVLDETAASVRLRHPNEDPLILQLENRIRELEMELRVAVHMQNYEQAAALRDEESVLRNNLSAAKQRFLSARNMQMRVVTAKDIAKTVADWTGIPLCNISHTEKKQLEDLEDTLSRNIIGQRQAVHSVAQAIRRGRAGLHDPNRPIGSFMFLGPSGVGKTALSKAVALCAFGSEQHLIRLDMSEYMEKHAVSRLIGAPPGYVGYDEGGQLTEQVRQKPYSVVVLDEIEKAHPEVFNLLLQVLEDGCLTDAQGRNVSFRNTVIIMTSNIGSQHLTDTQALGFSADEAQEQERERAVLKALKKEFRPEFINRIDTTVVFTALKQKDVEKIAENFLEKLQCRLEQQNVLIAYDRLVVTELAQKGYDKNSGARPLRRLIQTEIENPLADVLLSGKYTAPLHISISKAQTDGFVFTVQESMPALPV